MTKNKNGKRHVKSKIKKQKHKRGTENKTKGSEHKKEEKRLKKVEWKGFVTGRGLSGIVKKGKKKDKKNPYD